ncbi:MAG: dipeptidase [Candidatus Dormibacteraceae bacterium]
MSEQPLIPVFDGHNDVVHEYYGTRGERRSFFERGTKGHLDLPRMKEGGFVGGFFAVWTPNDPAGRRPDLRHLDEDHDGPPAGVRPAPVDPGFALRLATSLVGTLFRLERESEGAFKIARDASELRRDIEGGAITAVLHFEGAEPIDPGLNALEVFYRAGLRSLGLVWSRPNLFAEGVPFGFPKSPDTGPGLTPLGKDLVRACDEMGIMVDLSHLNEKGFWDVAEISRKPLVATHSNVHALTPCTRNLTDRQLDAIRDSGGMVGVNFAVDFTRQDGKHDADTPLTDLVRHVDYLADRIGIEHVGLGSDFDGCTVPEELGDAAGLPKLMQALRDHGFGEDDLRRIGSGNWIDLLARTWGA